MSALLEAVSPIEQFWAFPGSATFRHLRDLFISGHYDRFALRVARINRALVTESYRGATAGPIADDDREGDQADGPVVDQSTLDRPYFEVLVVETLTAAQEQSLREEVRRWRRPTDEFIYDLVVVGSAAEALVAVRLNAQLQACVLRRRFAREAAHDLSGLGHFIDTSIQHDLEGLSLDERTQLLGLKLARLRPELDLYLMTEI
ncbi:MAG TPA: hypothetical protein VHN80_23340, partial [Kineosporiaceae bacterium]|nr:hypothetical protein [Kineosporiaceae bacterium]